MYRLDINTKDRKFAVSDNLYGLFFEDINRSGDGGLYAELIRNRAFDEGIIPEGCEYDSSAKTITSPTGWVSSFDCYEGDGIVSWKCFDGAEMKLTDKGTLNENRKRALEVKFDGGYITNEGFMGINLEAGKSYRFYMFAKSEAPVNITVKLTSADNKIYAENSFTVSGEYARYECEFTSTASDSDSRLMICSEDSGMLTVGFVSLFPKDTFMGRENGLRKELCERLTALHPSFMRFPGGCIVEGFTKETAFRFADTIGPVWERKPHWNLWGYMMSNSLGYHEYLQLCEDMGIDAMYVFNCGMTCQGRCPDHFDDELIEEFYLDAVHAIEYATAPADTEWGRKRAENGHPEPFTVLKYLEIGNENWGEEYYKRYALFYDRLKKAYPDFIYIANEHTEEHGLSTEYVDVHHYNDPADFTFMSHEFDNIDRKGPDIYVGEYAGLIGCEKGTFYGALGEAAYLTGIERNQDKVKMTSFAPLFNNVGYTAWEPDMIVFNNHESYCIPSYYLQKMFAENRGSYVCGYNVETGSTPHTESGHFTDEDGNVAEGMIFTRSYDSPEKAGVRFWDKGMPENKRNYYKWIAENGKSKVVRYNYWCEDIVCDEIPFELPKGKFTIEIKTDADSFTITVNGSIIHTHTLSQIPDIYAVCTVDEKQNEIIAKIVNFSEKDISLQIATDCEVSDNAVITTLTADSRDAVNSFEQSENVVPFTENITLDNSAVSIKARSVNVVRFSM